MQQLFETYIRSVSEKFSHHETSEMGYRSDFELLLKGIFESIKVKRIDHDAKAQQGNKPDFVVINNEIPILYIEAKDITISLDKVEQSEQMARYFGYANLVLTNYLEFRFYRNGYPYGVPIRIAYYDSKHRTISPLPENYELVARTLLDFTQSHKEPIRSGKHLSRIMGGKAQRIRDNVRQFLSYDTNENNELKKVFETIKKQLVHDLSLESFADMYAQTLVYGLFVARYHDDSPTNFSRQEARDLIPASNPLLQRFFNHIVGPDFDPRLKHIVNELCEVFSHADVRELMKEYFKKGDDVTRKGPDPVIHFYEDFLKEYDSELRKKLGAFYTPLPVVEFIVQSVDYLLKTEFNLPGGLADTSKDQQGIHKVQILDPAVGTGTFFSTVIRNIYKKFVGEQEGRWHSYVHNELLPRIHGFELMMAPYTIAHLKLSIAFKETGFKYFNRRLGIYLTNSLENDDEQTGFFGSFGFAESIAHESKEASVIKNKKPIMVVVGNPPYSISSSNKGKWIQKLVGVYKAGLNEQNLNSLSDDYIKFIRFAEHFVEKNGSGIVAMITNNSFIDGIIHRQMRNHLLQTFDDLYILDLHGNSKKNEKSPDGSKDDNVFDIQQGVCIFLFVKKPQTEKKIGTIHFAELYGSRESKFEYLTNNKINDIQWKKVEDTEPYHFFVPKDFSLREEYEKGFKITAALPQYSSGIKTHRDHFVTDFNNSSLVKRIDQFCDISITDEEIRQRFRLKDSHDWLLSDARRRVCAENMNDKHQQITYKPFDKRWIYYSKHLIDRDRFETMKHMSSSNAGFALMRSQVNSVNFSTVLVVDSLLDINFYGFQTYLFPFYLYSADGSKVANLAPEVNNRFRELVGDVSPEDIFDYMYAVMYSSTYRQKFHEFLKIDFPYIPYPKDSDTFLKYKTLGAELRSLHLFKSPKLGQLVTTYPVVGNNLIEKIMYQDENVYINQSQYFGNVSPDAWNFAIGGYQPAQKWLKDRRGRVLEDEELEHYQRMIACLLETTRIQKELV